MTEYDEAIEEASGIPSYTEFRRSADILDRIKNVSRFTFSVYYQKNGLTKRPGVAEALLAEGLDILSDAFERTGIHRLHQFETTKQSPDEPGFDSDKPIVRLEFQDDVFACLFTINDDRFTITRPDSSIENFYSWYQVIMPNALSIEAAFRRVIERVTGGRLRVVTITHDFSVNFSNFLPPNDRSNRQHRNLDVLQRFISSLPDEHGEMRELSKQDFLRLDLTVSRIEKFRIAGKEKLRNAWYFLEAPSNEQGKFLAFRAQLRNSSSDQPDSSKNPMIGHEAVPFDPDYGDEHRLALIEFFKERAVQSFLSRLLETWTFDTPRKI